MGLGYKAHPKLDLYTDISFTRNIPAELKLGIEWKPINMLAIRLGGEQKSAGGNASYINGSAGVGFDLGVFGVDYAYYYDSVLTTNSRHFISISLKTPGITAPEPGFKEQIVAKAENQIVEPPKAEVTAQKQSSAVGVAKEPVSRTIEYVVKEGDCLSKITEKALGNWYLCYKVARENNIKKPDLIFPEQKIKIKK